MSKTSTFAQVTTFTKTAALVVVWMLAGFGSCVAAVQGNLFALLMVGVFAAVTYDVARMKLRRR